MDVIEHPLQGDARVAFGFGVDLDPVDDPTGGEFVQRPEQMRQIDPVHRLTYAVDARQRADELTTRLQKRMEDLKQERQISPLPPNVIGGAMIVPVGLIQTLQGAMIDFSQQARETKLVEKLAMKTVMEAERELGFEPRDVSADKCGYDIESRSPDREVRLRFLEVKGRVQGADTVTVTKNEILTALNKPGQFILAIVEVDGEKAVRTTYLYEPFEREPDFSVTSVNYNLAELLARGGPPR